MTTTQTIALKERLIPEVEEILNREVTRHEKLFAVCELLADEVSTFNWVGFYVADESGKEELVLGPFVGASTDHTRIPFGRHGSVRRHPLIFKERANLWCGAGRSRKEICKL